MCLIFFWFRSQPASQFPLRGRTGNFWPNWSLETGKRKQFCQETARAEIKNGNYGECKALFLGLIAASLVLPLHADLCSNRGGRPPTSRRPDQKYGNERLL